MGEQKSVHQLLLELKGGNIAAIDEIYAECSVSLYRRALFLDCPYEEPQDSVQHTLVKVIDNIDQYDEEMGGGMAWITSILVNHVKDIRRKHRRVGPFADDAGPPGGLVPGSDMHLRVLCIDETLDKLSSEELAAIDARLVRLDEGTARRPPKAFVRARDRVKVLFHECYENSPRKGGGQ